MTLLAFVGTPRGRTTAYPRKHATVRGFPRWRTVILLATSVCWVAPLKGQEPAQTSQPAGGASLVPNGDFEEPDADGRLPAQWTTERPNNVRLVGVPDEHGMIVELTGDMGAMGSRGVTLTSAVQITPRANTRYRCTGYVRSSGPLAAVILDGFATVKRHVKGTPEEMDEVVYSARHDLSPSAEWKRFECTVDVKAQDLLFEQRYEVKYLKLILWAYGSGGTCAFDDVRLEIVEHPAGDKPAAPRVPPATVPALPPGAQTQPASQPSDERRTFVAAANAFSREEYAHGLALLEPLVTLRPSKGEYRMVRIRLLARLERWHEADVAADWFVESPGPTTMGAGPGAEIEPWQREWARIIKAEAAWRRGDVAAARKWLEWPLRQNATPQGRGAAQALERRINEHEPAATQSSE